MSNCDTTKLRVLLLAEWFRSGKPFTVKEIITKLDLAHDIQVDRKTVYDDLNNLTYVYNIQVTRVGRRYLYQRMDL